MAMADLASQMTKVKPISLSRNFIKTKYFIIDIWNKFLLN